MLREVFSAATAVARLAPLIHQHAAAAESSRRYPPDVLQAFAEEGLFRLMVPRAAGGLEVDPMTVMQVVEDISRIDGSAGWLAMIGTGAGFISGFLPLEFARQIYADPFAMVGGNLGAPTGRALAVSGGYTITGRWPFMSGCDYATWLGGACVLENGDLRIMVFPKEQCEVLDTWTVTGLRATGSHDVRVTDLFVPKAHSFWWADGPTFDAPLYRVRFMLITHASHALGIARAALDAFAVLALTKVPTRTTVPLADRPLAQAALAQAEALVAAARDFMWRTTAEAWSTVCRGDDVSPRQRAELRLAMTTCVQNAAQAVDLLWSAAGGSPIYVSSPLERAFRDIHVATQHAAVGLFSWEVLGDALLHPEKAQYLI